ncbi:hypothetical protein H5410_037112 [Solanum commersonii]|uniref:Uncharacterized protein n=1 Tax=Solanum commersonii TaxID=4109 RepID=A0A9J5Y8K4_SOLCO|nr:hypothetical protein H5410_037112 [Solanum commersonii]
MYYKHEVPSEGRRIMILDNRNTPILSQQPNTLRKNGGIPKRRNIIFHGGSYTTNKVMCEINFTISKFIRLKLHTTCPTTWPQMVIMLVNYSHCNIDGTSRGNPGPSVAAFCFRYHEGSLVGDKGLRISDSTSLVVEASAINEGLH